MARPRKQKILDSLQEQLALTTAGDLPDYVDTCPAEKPARIRKSKTISPPVPTEVAVEFETPRPVLPAVIELEEVVRQPFGEWLLAQKDRKGWISELAKAAKADSGFPKRGSPDDVRRRMQTIGADGDAFEALDDAEMDWSTL